MSTKKLQFDSPGGGWWYKSISEYIYNGHSCIFKCSSSLTNFVYNLHYHKQKRILVISLACWIKILKVKQCQNRGKSNIIQWKNSPLKCKKTLSCIMIEEFTNTGQLREKLQLAILFRISPIHDEWQTQSAKFLALLWERAYQDNSLQFLYEFYVSFPLLWLDSSWTWISLEPQ